MATGVKGYLPCSSLHHISVPMYQEELSIEKILAWARQHHPQVVERYLPITRECNKLPRQVSTRPPSAGSPSTA